MTGASENVAGAASAGHEQAAMAAPAVFRGLYG